MKKLTAAFCLLSLLTMFPAFVAHPADTADAQWPQWRGPDFNGMARSSAPVEWSDTKNIKWKTAIPGRGFSTPVIWGNRMFLTTAVPTGRIGNETESGRRFPSLPSGGGGAREEQKFVALCVDRNTGETLWERTVKTTVPHEGYHRTYGSFASYAPITDGEHVWFTFGSQGLYCFDLNGKPIWQKNIGKLEMRNEFGEGGSPALNGDQLIWNFDQEGDSFIIALDKRSGKELWRRSRDEVSSWATPLVIEYKGRKQVVVSATGKVRAYDPANGKVIWECAGLGLNAIPAPVWQGDMIYAMTGFRDPKLMAIRLGRQGDLSGTDAIVWSQTRGTSYTPSPLLYDNKLWALTDNGMLSCFNAATGEPYYHQKRLPQPDSFKASPVGADGRIYLASESGVVTIVKMSEQFEVIAANTLADQFFVASPVIVAGDLYLRSKTHLFCISDSSKK